MLRSLLTLSPIYFTGFPKWREIVYLIACLKSVQSSATDWQIVMIKCLRTNLCSAGGDNSWLSVRMYVPSQLSVNTYIVYLQYICLAASLAQLIRSLPSSNKVLSSITGFAKIRIFVRFVSAEADSRFSFLRSR